MASLTEARRVVIKIGSALLVDRNSGDLRCDWLDAIAIDIAELRASGADVVLVSSGSIALGRRILGLPMVELPLEQSQAAAAVGQIRLARAWQEALAPHDLITAQVLVTLEDSADRRRYLNSRATLSTLLGFGTVPIVNENDTIATDEIRYGDNDRLAAQVAATVGADLLVLLSDVDGLYTGNPQQDPTAQRIDIIDHITPEIEAMAGDAGSGLSKGGMKTKVLAAKTATASGCAMIIMHGAENHPLRRLKNGAANTLFTPQLDPYAARKGWISAMKPQGVLLIDDGAAKALASGKSLLPAGLRGVEGRFGRGEPVAIQLPSGETLGQGLSRYTASEARAIAGRHSSEIESVLGYSGRAVLVHRDDMAL
ncbi:glutamate 5-kinase [Pelagimonas varians]|uniref:Glutamate 5-kinase n=1 Tax=Pelagimonas varians TaxID=696760 RepID=A0A238K8G8_9RHOB|nr:glutamate 5-kinase [Pelagimonas varians]PYG31705.1 glutamate 5-kinase [Pelagimonas varians]SMX38744.1 Glutamate 5-kinase [Pelagimonas varians]